LEQPTFKGSRNLQMPTNLRHALHLIGRDHRARFGGLVLLAVLASGFEMAGALLVYVLVGLVTNPDDAIVLPVIGDVRVLAGDIPERTLLLRLLIAMALFFIIRAVVQVGTIYVQKRVANTAGARLSIRLVEGYLNWPYAIQLRRTSAELIRNGHQAVQELVRQVFIPVIQVTAEIFLMLGMLALLVTIAPIAAALAVIVVGVATTLLLLVVQPRLKSLGRTAHRMQLETLGLLQQSFHGLRDIKVLGRERFFANRYGRNRLRLARALYLRSTVTELPHTIIELALVGFILVFFGSALGSGDETQAAVPVLGLFAYVGLRLQPSLQRIISGLNEIKYSAAPLEDLDADLRAIEAEPRRADTGGTLPFGESIRVEDVGYRYENSDRAALSDANLTIRFGEQIGICGPTGAGKTTLVDVIAGLLNPTSGCVKVDGQDLRDRTREWQRNLGIVPQMVFLIDDTVRRNVALGVPDTDIDEDAVGEAVELAQLSGYIASLPDGLNTTVGERGIRISGGQRQRIAIARALYRRPAVLIFDEGTSALDNSTEAELMGSIAMLRGKHTVILIAHRLSTVRGSDRIVFMERGRITGLGTYDELLRLNSSFRSMAEATG
jgi:ABC-type multidrug transport system fused ATPase/permease subunit